MSHKPRDGLPWYRILKLAERPEGFTVTWRDRDTALMAACRRMVRDGRLTSHRVRGGGSTTFHVRTQRERDQS